MLELRTQSRSSIIVVPTKALAYNKYKSIIAEKGEDYALYVGCFVKDVLHSRCELSMSIDDLVEGIVAFDSQP